MIGWPPPASAPGFDPLRWIVLYEGPYRDAKQIVAKVDAARLPNKLEIPDPPQGTVVLVLVPAKFEAESRRAADA
jgi:hypothetical protein